MKKGYRIFLSLIIACFGAKGVLAVTPCPSGFSAVSNVVQSTFMSPMGGLCQIGGYTLVEIPDEFSPIYNGFIMGSANTLCDDGHLSGNTCTQFTTGSCENGKYDIASNGSTFMAPVGGMCQIGGYSVQTLPDDFTAVYNGFLMGAEVVLCDNGYRSNNSSCVPYGPTDGSGNCDIGYYDLAINANTFTGLTNGNCSSPYAKFTNTTRCDHNPGGTCVDIPTPIVSISWSDDNGNTTTNTCTYEETIVLPQTPSRPGYIFNGWKLATE
jgi:hypothetical protein